MADYNVSRTQTVTVSEGAPATGSTVTIAGWSHEINVSDARVVGEGPTTQQPVTIADWTYLVSVTDSIWVRFDWGGPYNLVCALRAVQAPYYEQIRTINYEDMSRIRGSGYYLQSDIVYGGTKTLCVVPGGYYEVLYACDAGAAAITCYGYYETGANLLMEVVEADGSGEVVASTAVSGGANQWELMTVNFTAVKGFYIVRLSNKKFTYGEISYGKAYFDNIE